MTKSDKLDQSAMRLAGVHQINGTTFSWEVRGSEDRRTIEVSNPELGHDTTHVDDLPLLEAVERLARGLLAKKN